MMALVSAGFALGLVGAAHMAGGQDQGVVLRPLALQLPPLMTYLLYAQGEPSDALLRFVDRVQAIESPEAPLPTLGQEPDSVETDTP